MENTLHSELNEAPTSKYVESPSQGDMEKGIQLPVARRKEIINTTLDIENLEERQPLLRCMYAMCLV